MTYKYANVQTKWGKSDGGVLLFSEKLNGKDETIVQYFTPSHGGLKLSRKLNSLIPAELRMEGGWYEEDCKLAIPLYYHGAMVKAFIQANPSPDTERLIKFIDENYFEGVIKRYDLVGFTIAEDYTPSFAETKGFMWDYCYHNPSATEHEIIEAFYSLVQAARVKGAA